MNNIFDNRIENNLFFCLPNNEDLTDWKETNKRVAVFAYLYYDQTLSNYIDYLVKIGEDIHLYLLSSDELVLAKVREAFGNRKNVFYILKENRGRDVAALLVDARKYVFEYDYFCFIHDKRVKCEEVRNDVQTWIKSMWDNMLCSDNHVRQIVKLFEENSNLGVLLPPEPLGERIYSWYHNSWDLDFEPMEQLAKEFHLNCNLDRNKAPISLGTALWARTDSLRKLFEKEWQYDDFPGEPFPEDGSVSHAIERSFGYFAQDAGYETGTVMTNEYAGYVIGHAQMYCKELFEYLTLTEGIKNIHSLRLRRDEIRKYDVLLQHRDNIYVYGAGIIAERVIPRINELGIHPRAVLVSHLGDKRQINGIPIVQFDRTEIKDGDLIVIAAGLHNSEEIATNLENAGINKYVFSRSFF